MLAAAVSYWPMRLLPCGVMAREVTMYTGPTWRPAVFAARQSVYGPSALSTTSCLFAVSQQTCEPTGWVEFTMALGKVLFCFSVIRTHLYFREEAVLVPGEVLGTYAALLRAGACAEPHAVPVPGATYVAVSPANHSWQNSSSK